LPPHNNSEVFDVDNHLGDVATWIGAIVAGVAALFTWQQAHVARRQLQESQKSALEDDDRRRKQVAVELAQEWCRTEAPSPISILRECLIASAADATAFADLLDGRATRFPLLYQSEIKSFFENAMGGHVDLSKITTVTSDVVVSQNYSHLIQNFFARRVNFLEVVAAAFNSNLADKNLVEQFFGRILDTNPSYHAAVTTNASGWPELAKFYTRVKSRPSEPSSLV
jgi:hypothetical protein